MNAKNNAGFTALELILVLTVIAVMGAALFIKLAPAMASGNITKATDSAAAVISVVNGMTGQGTLGGGYADLSNAVIKAGSRLPKAISGSGTLIRSPWAQDGIEVGPYGPDSGQFFVRFKSVPQKGCVDFVAAELKAGHDAILVNGTAVNGLAALASVCSATNEVLLING